MNKNLKISVIIPVFNGEKYVQEAIESVLKQSYKNKELIVIDDCSKDGSRDVISNLYKEHHFTYIKNSKNLGLAKNLNKGIKNTNNPDFIFILQNDCVLKEHNYLSKMVAHFEKDSSVGAVTGKPEIKNIKNISFVDKLNILLYLSDIYKYESGICEINFIEGRADAYRYYVIEKAGFFDEKLRMAGEDIIMSQKIIDQGYKIIQDNDLIYYIGYGGNQDSYLKLLVHTFKIAEALPYVIKKYGFRVASKKLLTKNRRLRKNLRLTQCLTLFFTVLIVLLAFVDIRFLWLFLLLCGWRVFYYLKLIYPNIHFKSFEKVIYVLTGILSDYFYSMGILCGRFFVLFNKKI